MSTRTILVVFLALLSGAGVAVGVLQSHSSTSTVETTTETEPVLVAIANIERGSIVTEANVELRQWPKGQGLAPADTMRSIDSALGRPAVGQILAGEIVREVKLAQVGSRQGVEAVIPKGMRAVAVVASRINTNVAGFVLPGSKVDVLLHLRANARDDDSGGGSTTTLLQAIEVLAVDQKQDAPAANQFDPKALASVTLLVTPEQANLLDLAQNAGTLSFALRNVTDMADAKVSPATLAEIRRLSMTPNHPPMMLSDEDQSAMPEMASINNVSRRAKESTPQSIFTLRGTQRGRVLLLEAKENW